MRWILGLILIAAVLMFLGGWLYFRDTGKTSEVILDKQEMRQDTEKAVEKGKELLKKAAEETQTLGKKAEEALSDDHPQQPKQPAGDAGKSPSSPAAGPHDE